MRAGRLADWAMPAMPHPMPDRLPFARRAGIVAVAVALNGALYMGINQRSSRIAHEMALSAFDLTLGRPAWTIWPYWLLLLLAPAMALAIPGRRLFFATLRAYAVSICINASFWLALPTRLARPALPPGLDPATAWAWRALRLLDGPGNCFPSGHITLPLVIAAGFSLQHPRTGRFAWLAIALLAPSVVTTGQHVVLDIAGGAATALAGLVITRHPILRRWASPRRSH